MDIINTINNNQESYYKPYLFIGLARSGVLGKDPRVIIKAARSKVASGCGASDQDMKKLREQVMSRTEWQQMKAVKDGRVYIISSEIYSGPRAPVGVIYFAKWLYPQLFSDLNPEAVHKEFLSRFHGMDDKGAWVFSDGL